MQELEPLFHPRVADHRPCVCDDFTPILAEFIAQVRHRTDVLYEARERGFIAKLNPQTFEPRHL